MAVAVESIGQIDHIIREGVRALVSGLRKGQQRPNAVWVYRDNKEVTALLVITVLMAGTVAMVLMGLTV